jgi:DNA repair exonuclease SbcCD ATPase subunit
VIEAVVAFESLPEQPQSGDETAGDLRTRLAALGSLADGDCEVDPSVSRAARVWDAAQLARERAGEARPERREQILAALRRRRAVRRGLGAAAAVAALAAFALGLDERWTAAGAALAIGLGAAIVATLRSDTGLSRALARVEEELAHQTRLDGEVERAGRDLAEALAARGAPECASVGESLLAYREACAERARDDEARRELERALGPSARREQEQARRDATRAEAARRLAELAGACGVAASEPVALARELRAWHAARLAELPARERAIRERSELAALLDGRDLPALERLAANARAEADALGTGVPADDARTDEELARALAEARSARETASAQRAELEARLAERRSALPSVAEAEEELARAEAERARVVELHEILEQTESFLERAQESAHRSIAPRLAEDLRAHLPRVTTGRWLDASVDPADLGVQLAGSDGVWRPVAQLSHGTREQVWLLLRIALARRLVRAGETSPLVLDDVTVHFDADRTSAALEALRAIARERQVVLFTQEAQVRDWAREQLRAPDDRLIELSPPGSA